MLWLWISLGVVGGFVVGFGTAALLSASKRKEDY